VIVDVLYWCPTGEWRVYAEGVETLSDLDTFNNLAGLHNVQEHN